MKGFNAQLCVMVMGEHRYFKCDSWAYIRTHSITNGTASENKILNGNSILKSTETFNDLVAYSKKKSNLVPVASTIDSNILVTIVSEDT